MKRCPECRRDYYDDSLLYCLDDGSLLLEGPAVSPDQQATLVIERRSLYSDMAGSRLDLAVRTNADVANAVAVLPFANLSRAEDSEYLSDGLAEELISILSKIKGIRVVARTSAFAFKGQKVGVAEIGRILHAQFIVEGSVRMSGDRVRVAVQLVNTTDGYHRWSETYDRRLTDLFAIQDDIAQSVVNELRETLIGARDAAGQENVSDELANAIRGRANDPEAYRLMLLGRHLLDRSNENDAVKAVAYLKESLELDPSNASCWVLLGRAYFEA